MDNSVEKLRMEEEEKVEISKLCDCKECREFSRQAGTGIQMLSHQGLTLSLKSAKTILPCSQ